jgi:DNA-binding transcriptional LysR family regulator
MRVNDGTVLRAAILAGIGIGMMPASEVDEELAAGALVPLLPHLEVVGPRPGGEGLFAVYQRSSYQTGKLRSFLAFLPEVFAT